MSGRDTYVVRGRLAGGLFSGVLYVLYFDIDLGLLLRQADDVEFNVPVPDKTLAKPPN